MIYYFQIHCSSCGFNPVLCPNADCGMIMEKLELLNHLKNECPFRLINCELCDDQVAANLMGGHHKNYCPGIHIRCPHCGKDGIPRGKVKL